jgi:hypothetical protein
MFREILMDLNDAEGDRASGVWTLPVLLGKPAALASATLCLLLGSGAALARLLAPAAGSGALLGAAGAGAVGASSAAAAAATAAARATPTAVATGAAAVASWPLLQQGLVAAGVAWSPAWHTAIVVALPALLLLAAVGQLGRLALAVSRSGFDRAVVSHAVDECLKPVGATIILLAALS